MATSGLVYMAINLVNDKIYIGATEKGLSSRRARHFWNAKTGRPGKFYNAIRKYGKNKFSFVEVLKCKDFWEALREEELYIKALKPHYNLTAGGGGVKGYKFSAESRAKMSAAKLGKPGRITHSNPVKCKTDGLVFRSVSEAAKYYSLDRATIVAYCKKQGKTRRLNLEFEYVEAGGGNLQH